MKSDYLIQLLETRKKKLDYTQVNKILKKYTEEELDNVYKYLITNYSIYIITDGDIYQAIFDLNNTVYSYREKNKLHLLSLIIGNILE